MKEKVKNKVIAIGFAFILFIVLISNVIKKDEEISISERRKLAKFPTINFENLSSGKVAENIDKYTVDQFILRDNFRSIKSFWSNYIYRKKDNNGLFLIDESIYKIEYPLKEENVKKTCYKINNVCEKYLNNNMRIYYSIIPDKNYYLSSDYLKIDVNEMQEIVSKELKNMEYIDITSCLDLQDFYKTDLHWKQENLRNVVNKIENKMNLKITSNNNYNISSLGDFYGSYYGQLGMKIEPDIISVLTNDVIENSVTYNYETSKKGKVYDIEKWKSSSDKYDIYLSGATPIISIENKNGTIGKELILFRDSFGSSIAPLLLENYEKITLIDLRYISSSILDKYISFENQDVLFLYSSLIINQNILK